MANYAIPGVYVEEIPKFPPSVAQVPTAIPAFIGHTEITTDKAGVSLLNKAVRIGSQKEYEQIFGLGPHPDITKIVLDANNNFVSATLTQKYYMYDAIRLFYANGGGDCYIISVADYNASVNNADYTDPGKALEVVSKIDEPTILLFPDAATLDADKLGTVQKMALKQCGELKDRVAIFDLRVDNYLGDEINSNPGFRGNIGMNDLKYGMAYTPWLTVALPKNVTYKDLNGKSIIEKPGTGKFTIDNKQLHGDNSGIKGLLKEYKAALDWQKEFEKYIIPTPPDEKDLVSLFTLLDSTITFSHPDYLTDKKTYKTALTNYQNNPDATKKEALQAAYSTLNETISLIYNQKGIETKALDDWKTKFTSFINPTPPPTPPTPALNANDLNNSFNALEKTITSSPPKDYEAAKKVYNDALNTYQTASDATKKAALQAAYSTLNDIISLIYSEQRLIDVFAPYKAIIAGINATPVNVPPSGAVAGIFAYVDRTRGVWKAPANVSLNGVIGPSHDFSRSELEKLNIDVNTGKSINAIRQFTGKGTLIFGARTLAGNDNEWRYIPVRRFYNMVEESIKKACEQFVFEPNDANTWTRLQAMIENFLFLQWREGALQGIKPEHAYFVAVGLGKTMTSQDILEGRLIVEIGMAPVRPAEFIILRFSQKMAES
jgi:phage tail sheath protein FI